jgi:outer membrane beta-barrel protein
MHARLRPWVVLAGLVMAGGAQAAEPENVVVRNRLYNPEGTFELGVEVSSTIVQQMVSHTNIQAIGAYNFNREWAAEVLVGYAVSGLTDIANQVSSQISSVTPAQTPTINDFSNMWQMKFNAVADARWAPIYGKLSLSAEIPVHFQAYLVAGGGVASLQRTSVAYCLSPAGTDANNDSICPDPLVENRVAPVAQFGGGLRFFIGPHVALRLEVRDYAFTDQYNVNIQRAEAEAGSTTAGTPASAGIEQLVFMTAGLTYIF